MRLTIAVSIFTVSISVWAFSSQAHAQSKENQQPKETKNTVLVDVKPGDSLSTIASQHQTTYPRLFDANPNIAHPDLIYPGDKVRIPEAGEQLASRPLPSVTPTPRSTAGSQPAKKSSPVSAKINYSTPSGGGIWAALAKCESGGNWAANTGNGYYGGLQFTLSSWRSAGGSGYPNQASSAEQIARAQVLQSKQGWGAWPACSAKLGL